MADPTIVLVHGAFADASSWSQLYAELAGDGLVIKAPPNPLRGVTGGDAEYMKCVIEQIEGPVLLVGHSYGGAVITAAGVADNVAGLVYVAGFGPDEGEDLGALQSNFPAPVAGPYIKASPLPDGGGEFTINPSGFHEAFCADLPAAQAAFMAISQRPLSGVAFGEKAPTPAWRTRPSWAVLPTADGAIHPDVHRFSYDPGPPDQRWAGGDTGQLLDHGQLFAVAECACAGQAVGELVLVGERACVGAASGRASQGREARAFGPSYVAPPGAQSRTAWRTTSATTAGRESITTCDAPSTTVTVAAAHRGPRRRLALGEHAHTRGDPDRRQRRSRSHGSLKACPGPRLRAVPPGPRCDSELPPVPSSSRAHSKRPFSPPSSTAAAGP